MSRRGNGGLRRSAGAGNRRGSARLNPAREQCLAGQALIASHPLFGELWKLVWVVMEGKDSDSWARVFSHGCLWINEKKRLEAEQWAFVIAHDLLHLAFGHFDEEKMPQEGRGLDRRLWNCACDLYIHRFLTDMKFGRPPVDANLSALSAGFGDEAGIYEFLKGRKVDPVYLSLGTAGSDGMDMGGSWPVAAGTSGGQSRLHNRFAMAFGRALAYSVSDAVSVAGGHGPLREIESPARMAANWFLTSYPLLGGLAAGFRIVEDYELCRRENIAIAAVDVTAGEIYINPARKLSKEELRFVIAHEYLHAGLLHHQRARGREPYLWNVACDFVINGWLTEMNVGSMPPEGILYDERLSGRSAEEIYDEIVRDLRAAGKYNTFRGNGQGDVMAGSGCRRTAPGDGSFDKLGGVGSSVDLDEFYRNALAQGLELHHQQERGLLPAGLEEEIRALAVPPIPWEVELAAWFDGCLGPVERIRSYARASRRQSATPDIPRPGVKVRDALEEGRTFGVIIDTSGSMDVKLLGKALGAVASYAASREVPYVRVVFCDAAAYDAGYLAPEDIAGRVTVRGRGGTVLQPGVDLLLESSDFPKKGPVLIITDGGCEPRVEVKREHAWLLPQGCALPFRDRGKVFRFQ